jgi:hypothetical protein
MDSGFTLRVPRNDGVEASQFSELPPHPGRYGPWAAQAASIRLFSQAKCSLLPASFR